MRGLIKGLSLLIVVTFIGECLEFFINMVLVKELGEKGMGMYMSILPSVFLVVIVASLELPVSISKFVAESEQLVHLSILKHALKLTCIFTFILLIATYFLFPYIPIFQSYHVLLKWILIAIIPVVAFTSIARGYFMGIQNMSKIAISNFLKKSIQLLLLVILYRYFQFNNETAIIVAIFTILGAECIVFLYLIQSFYIRIHQLKYLPKEKMKWKNAYKQLLATSIPTTGLRLFYALTGAIQPFFIKFTLLKTGMSENFATEQFGVLVGVAFTIGFFPAFIAHSFLIVLIPAVSEAYGKRDFIYLTQLLKKVFLATALYGIPSIFVFVFYGDVITQVFFGSTTASYYLKLLWPFFLMHFFVLPMQAFLIGFGLVREALNHSILSTTLSFVVMYWLGSQPHLQFDGIIIGMNAGMVLLFMLHYLTVCKNINFPLFPFIPLQRVVRSPLQDFEDIKKG